jgi:hypothetical protein
MSKGALFVIRVSGFFALVPGISHSAETCCSAEACFLRNLRPSVFSCRPRLTLALGYNPHFWADWVSRFFVASGSGIETFNQAHHCQGSTAGTLVTKVHRRIGFVVIRGPSAIVESCMDHLRKFLRHFVGQTGYSHRRPRR